MAALIFSILQIWKGRESKLNYQYGKKKYIFWLSWLIFYFKWNCSVIFKMLCGTSTELRNLTEKLIQFTLEHCV